MTCISTFLMLCLFTFLLLIAQVGPVSGNDHPLQNNWSGQWESNPPLKLGKLSFYQ